MNIKLAEILISCWFFFGKYRILPILAVFFQADLFHYNPVWLSHVLLAHFSLCHPPTPIINSQASQHTNNNNNQQCSSSSSNKRGSRFGSVRCCCSKEKEGSTRFWVFFTWPPLEARILRETHHRHAWRDVTLAKTRTLQSTAQTRSTVAWHFCELCTHSARGNWSNENESGLLSLVVFWPGPTPPSPTLCARRVASSWPGNLYTLFLPSFFLATRTSPTPWSIVDPDGLTFLKLGKLVELQIHWLLFNLF